MSRPSKPRQIPLRVVTAAALYDGHDASIHIMRRILQSAGAEVIHLGHNRGVGEIVKAIVEEDADAVAISSYQGGHMEYFGFLKRELDRLGFGHVGIYGGGGGVISPPEIKRLHRLGISRIFTPDDGRLLGLEGMIHWLLEDCRRRQSSIRRGPPKTLEGRLSRDLSDLEKNAPGRRNKKISRPTPVLGFTGPGGAGKSSLMDELALRFLESDPKLKIAILCVDPSSSKSGGALLGDRLRFNCAESTRIYFRSIATRAAHRAVSPKLLACVDRLCCEDFDLIFVETAGIGQSDSSVRKVCDHTVYVMTSEYGATSQLDKIDMLDWADFVALNKFDRPGSSDALREVRKALVRRRKPFDAAPASMPVFATCSHRFGDTGVQALYDAMVTTLFPQKSAIMTPVKISGDTLAVPGLLPAGREHYLGEIASCVRRYHESTQRELKKLRQLQAHFDDLRDAGAIPADSPPQSFKIPSQHPLAARVQAFNEGWENLKDETREALREYHQRQRQPAKDPILSPSGLNIARVVMPELAGWPEQFDYVRSENLPGSFPFTAGVFERKRKDEDPTRMFAGEGGPETTNRRFHLIAKDAAATRLSTAFDSVTLYGADPDKRPDIYGKIGNAGVSICCLDDMKRLYSGFDLSAPSTSVSMTINGPAPMILAFFLNTAIDAACERHLRNSGKWKSLDRRINSDFRRRGIARPHYRTKLPAGHDGSGLGTLGLNLRDWMVEGEYQEIRQRVLRTIRGTVQADILKEDQAQNTCIFSSEFALRMMGDVQQTFIDEGVRNFYSVSVSGYHIAEAGATPVTQLAFTLANAFTYAEIYLRRGMRFDDFAVNFSFFFSNGLDPEYAVLSRVARRIWALAARHVYGGAERSQKLKCHIQTSGRSLHSQNMDFNDIRTTLQALYAMADHCNSLHTNAYDEALTTPTENSLRRAMAIQLILLKEFGLTANENPLQGSYLISQLTDRLEDAVLREFEALDARGGVLRAMEYQYQRSRIQDESMAAEHAKHSGSAPVIGVNTFVADKTKTSGAAPLRRSSQVEKDAQVNCARWVLRNFKDRSKIALEELKRRALAGNNVFSCLLDISPICTLGQMSQTLFEVGGKYRRNM